MSGPVVRVSSARWASVAAGGSAERSGVNRWPGCRRRSSASAATARWRWARVAASQWARSAMGLPGPFGSYLVVPGQLGSWPRAGDQVGAVRGDGEHLGEVGVGDAIMRQVIGEVAQ